MVVCPEKVSWHCGKWRVAHLGDSGISGRGEMKSALRLSQSQVIKSRVQTDHVGAENEGATW